jgi:D-serine deaminase-like pyridoxal phosphate-dependent protein
VLPDFATPCLVVDERVLRRNIQEMADLATGLGVALRPHAKTHKSPAIADLQLQAGAVGLTVATLSEALVFAEAGVRDLFIAYPLWIDSTKGPLLRRLEELGIDLTVGCDSAESAEQIARHSSDPSRIRVLVEVDSGQHRSGVPAETVGSLARAVLSAGLDVRGVFTFPGHSYRPSNRETAAREEAVALVEAAASVRTAGIDVSVVSGGSTPTIEYADAGTASELRPGVYVFGDAQQWELGSCTPEQIALTCLATVVSRRPGRVVLDAGSKALGADRAPWASGYGRLLDHPDARIVQLSEHHAVVDWADERLPECGERMRVVPNHVCNAVNLTDELVVVNDGALTDTWPVAARGANT